MRTGSPRRIFWLGMHVVLTRTELPRLRQLGYEVFHPPYESGLYDQSAEREWDADQPTTLPRDVFELLSRTRFFYEPIPPDAATALNEHFEAVVVTIHPRWLAEVLRVFRGKVIYRTYGQLETLGDLLAKVGVIGEIERRGDFHIVPFAPEPLEEEHSWLLERVSHIVPYCAPPSVSAARGSWQAVAGERSGEILIPIPNVRNPYYARTHRRAAVDFPGSHFRIIGVQPSRVRDPRVVGTIPMDRLISLYRHSAGLLSPYREPRVCYLPPIEMMMVGGPVAFPADSLLGRFVGRSAPGAYTEVREARAILERFRAPDDSFIREVLDSQADAVRRYSPEHVWPIFDRAFRDLLDGSRPPPARAICLRGEEQSDAGTGSHAAEVGRVYLLGHFPGRVIRFRRGHYFSDQGLLRVSQKIIRALLERTAHEVVVTCRADQFFETLGFFKCAGSPGDRDRVRVMVVDEGRISGGEPDRLRRIDRWSRAAVQSGRAVARRFVRGFRRSLRDRSPSGIIAFAVAALLLAPIAGVLWILTLLFSTLRRIAYAVHIRARGSPFVRRLARGSSLVAALRGRARRGAGRRVVDRIDGDPRARFVLVPHYYHFPEARELRGKWGVMLLDYIPHFFPGVPFEPGRDRRNARIGRELCAAATAILTSSEYSRSYLPDTALAPEARKIGVVTLPLLVGEMPDGDPASTADLSVRLASRRFLFYPTQNRPNKQLAFLLQVFAELAERHADLDLVITGDPEHHAPMRRTLLALATSGLAVEGRTERLRVDPARIHILRGLSDAAIGWLYRRSAALCFTSTAEGNFPPQIFEALRSAAPVVASRIPMILELLGELSERLLLCPPLDRDSYVAACEVALSDRRSVLARQESVLAHLEERASEERFVQELMEWIRAHGLLPESEIRPEGGARREWAPRSDPTRPGPD